MNKVNAFKTGNTTQETEISTNFFVFGAIGRQNSAEPVRKISALGNQVKFWYSAHVLEILEIPS